MALALALVLMLMLMLTLALTLMLELIPMLALALAMALAPTLAPALTYSGCRAVSQIPPPGHSRTTPGSHQPSEPRTPDGACRRRRSAGEVS
jgi:hypothetical protein